MKTVICYTTEYGTSTYCVSKLAACIKSEVDVVNLSEHKALELSGYDVIILGGSVHMGKLGRELKRLIKKELSAIIRKKVYLFLNCLEKDKFDEFLSNSFPKEVIDIAIDMFNFGGRIEVSKLSRTHQMVLKIIGKDQDINEIDENSILKLCENINSLENKDINEGE